MTYIKVVTAYKEFTFKLDPDLKRFGCSNADVEKAVADRVPLLDTCACCERRIVVLPHDADPDDYPVVAAYLKGGRPH